MKKLFAMMKRLLVVSFALVPAIVSASSDVMVQSVTARQIEPWGWVEIDVTITGVSNYVAAAKCTFAATNSAAKAALPIKCITDKGVTAGSGEMWMRTFYWNAVADVGTVKIDDVALAVEASYGVQLWENGPFWAECNVGATKPEEYGYYFWWGDIVGYKREGESWNAVDGSRTGFSFSHGNCPTYGMNNSQLQSAGYIDTTGNLVAAHDAVTAHLGAPWRMPTDAEFTALISNCDTEWTSRNGVYGRLVKGRGGYSSKSIFLPAAGLGFESSLIRDGGTGYCRSATPTSDSSYNAMYLNFNSDYFHRYDYPRDYGQSVRPIRGFVQ